MKIADIQKKAISMGIKPGKIKKVELIRTIQRHNQHPLTQLGPG